MNVSVLLVEDDIHDVEVVERAFSRIPSEIFSLQHVDRISDAIKEIRNHHFNVILLDLGLPDSLGLNGIKRLIDLASEIPIVVLTGHRDDEMAIKGIELGAQEFLCKDQLEPRALVRAIQHAIKRKQYLSARLGIAGDESLRQRLDKVGKTMRGLYESISTGVADLRATNLNPKQEKIVAHVEQTTVTSRKALDRMMPQGVQLDID